MTTNSFSSSGQSHAGFKRGDLHELVTGTIIRQLEAGTVPWQRPWKGEDFQLPGLPMNFCNGKHYRGINIILLWCASLEHKYSSPEWATFKQWQERKERIRKGEKGTTIVYYDMIEKEVDGEPVKIPFLKSYTVFNRCQLDSYQPDPLKPYWYDSTLLVEKIEKVDEFIGNTHAIVDYGGTEAYYNRTFDLIYMPEPEQFISSATCTATEGFYATLLHELVHWSGSPKRLDRTKGKKFGDQNYANEELVAELGAAFLCAGFDITTADKGNHASYIDHWLQVLRNDKHCLIRAAAQASKAVDYLHGIQPACTFD